MVAAELRQILARIATDEAARQANDDTPLLRDGLGLDSLSGTILLAEVQRQFGVDAAGEDLNLDCLASFGALTDFIAERVAAR